MTQRNTDPRWRSLGGALAFTLLFVACGDGSTGPAAPAETPTAEAEFPVTLDAANGEVTLEVRPKRIVSLSPTSTEMLFAIGAGDQVAAVDDQSDYPPEAPATELSGFEPNIEAVAGYEPDLVVTSNETGQMQKSFDALGIPFLLQPAAATLDDTYAQIEELGTLTGHAAEAEAIVETMRSEIDEIRMSLPVFDDPPTYFHELDDTYFTVTSETFIGEIYDLVGLENIADAADKAGTGYPQLSAEYILEADPDLIFLADTKCCDQSPATVEKRPGWSELSAVRNDAVIGLDDDIASRWGPRVVDLLRTVAAAVADLGH